jgi:hypothetical protein
VWIARNVEDGRREEPGVAGTEMGWTTRSLGLFPSLSKLAKRANVAEAALLAVEILEQDHEQEIASEDAKCAEDYERHDQYRGLQIRGAEISGRERRRSTKWGDQGGILPKGPTGKRRRSGW